MSDESKEERDGNGWPKSWGIVSCFGRMGVLHTDPFPHYVGESGCDCEQT